MLHVVEYLLLTLYSSRSSPPYEQTTWNFPIVAIIGTREGADTTVLEIYCPKLNCRQLL